jgi:hypothetical protein
LVDGRGFVNDECMYLPKLNNLRRIKDMVRDITLTPIASNWWTGFSTWKDFHGILRSGSKISMHYIVTKINSQLELLENNMSYVDVIDDNGNIIIQHDETFPTIAQQQQLTMWQRTQLVKILEIPHSLNILVTKFLDTYSGDYCTA